MSTMSKVTKKYLLVSLDGVEDQKGMTRKLRRYLNSHKLRYLFAACPEEMKSYVDKVFFETLNFNELAEEQRVYDGLFDASLIGAASNQEVLEKWARGENPEGVEALQLLFGAHAEQEEAIIIDDDEESNGGSDNEGADKEERETDNCLPKLFTENSVDVEIIDEKKEECAVWQECKKCNAIIDVGKNRNTKIKRQALHVIFAHSIPEFSTLDVFQRYECQKCQRLIPVQKSLCDHITDCHVKDNAEVEFKDLWSKDQLASFNFLLEQCFNRQLPVPRSRRARVDETTSTVPTKAPYSIKNGDEVVHLETIAEKEKQEKDKAPATRTVVEKKSSLSPGDTLFLIDDDDDDEMPLSKGKGEPPSFHDHALYCQADFYDDI